MVLDSKKIFMILFGKREESHIVTSSSGLPLTMRYTYKQGEKKVDEMRSVLDDLTHIDLIWLTFESYRQYMA